MANGTGYSAGNLEFVTQQISDKTLSSLDVLIAKLKTTMSLLGSTSSISKNLGSTAGRTSTGGRASLKDTNKQLKVSSFSLAKIMNKVYFLRNYTKQMFATAGRMLNLAVDYTETLNLWQVAMRDNRKEADEFVKTMNKAYGISTQTLMNYQAIFRNMLSSLGGLSENTSYALSEYLTQMAIDYASLYNTSIERAMTTFQSVLSGQVRPIRSIAGYDITETTIFQLYQQLGGTKTMRQLTQTEKRLLRIYAVFQQMESSGAIGDLNRTLGNTANQMRILSESSKELQTWFGLIVEDMLKPALPYLNAFVITLTNIVKAIAKMRNVKLFEGGAVESVQEINKALDETQGKLLSFDRFEALNSSEDGSNLLGIDENLLAGLSQYQSILDNVYNKGKEIAEGWTSWWVDSETGELTTQAQNLLDVLEAIGIALGILIGLSVGKKLLSLGSTILGLKASLFSVKNLLLTGLVAVLITMSSKGAEVEPVIWGIVAAISALLALKLVDRITALIPKISDLIFRLKGSGGLSMALLKLRMNLQQILSTNAAVSVGIGVLSAGIALFVSNLDNLSSTAQILIPVLSALAGVLAAVAIAKAGFTWRAALAAGSIVAGIGMVVGTLASMQQFKTGGQVEDGVFTMNRKEMAGSFDDGTSIVANNMQIQQGIAEASYRGLSRALQESAIGGVGDVYLDGRKVGMTTAKSSHNEMVRTGLTRATR